MNPANRRCVPVSSMIRFSYWIIGLAYNLRRFAHSITKQISRCHQWYDFLNSITKQLLDVKRLRHIMQTLDEMLHHDRVRRPFLGYCESSGRWINHNATTVLHHAPSSTATTVERWEVNGLYLPAVHSYRIKKNKYSTRIGFNMLINENIRRSFINSIINIEEWAKNCTEVISCQLEDKPAPVADSIWTIRNNLNENL